MPVLKKLHYLTFQYLKENSNPKHVHNEILVMCLVSLVLMSELMPFPVRIQQLFVMLNEQLESAYAVTTNMSLKEV